MKKINSKQKVKKVKKRNFSKRLLLVIIGLIVLAGGYLAGKQYYQKDAQIDRMVKAIQDPQSSLAQYVVPSTTDMQVTDKSLKPLQSYFKHNKLAANKLSANLKAGRDTKQIRLVRRGSWFLLFPKYQLRVQVYSTQVKTNQEHAQLYVDGHAKGQMSGSGSTYYADWGLVFPGRYHVEVKTKSHGRKLQASSIVNVWSNRTINMNIKTATFQVRSLPNAKIYINDKAAGQLNAEGVKVFHNYPITKSMELYVTSKYHGKTIKSLPVRNFTKYINFNDSSSDDGAQDYDSEGGYYLGENKHEVYQDDEGDYVVSPSWKGLIKADEAAKQLFYTFKNPSSDQFIKGEKSQDYLALVKTLQTLITAKTKSVKTHVEVTNLLPAGDNLSDVTYQVTLKIVDQKKASKTSSNQTSSKKKHKSLTSSEKASSSSSAKLAQELKKVKVLEPTVEKVRKHQQRTVKTEIFVFKHAIYQWQDGEYLLQGLGTLEH
ncbi:TcaA 3rd/4th domain-containing protein [Lactobacillus corticis]|uniref:TcaA 4th domain-containing protein n=1 Tax=Lactobacillus corticis TaxID=2201249 RepID=A0A916QJJ9_9LACO|nr:hypothetical protein [Lactobacillus corticis]GFZ26793.1 hypothetical protein LCB40_06730 [Lactobacillus corticis]